MKINNLIDFYFIFISIKLIFAEEFIDIQKLFSKEIYFVILDTGLYLYDLNNLNCALIYEFKDEYQNTKNNIILKEFHYKYKTYIICLVNEYLFIFNENTYTFLNYKIQEISQFKSYYYDIIPYKIENNYIGFIVVINKDVSNLFFHFYNFSLTEGINTQFEIPFTEMNIQNKKIRCQIDSNFKFFICFYYSIINDENCLYSTMFYIDNMNLKKGNTSLIDKSVNKINQIKIATSFDDNFFICYSNASNPICFINDDLYNFKEIGCKNGEKWSPEYRVLFFNETNDFMLISRGDLTITLYNNLNNTLLKCKKTKIFGSQKQMYSIIYNNGYKKVNYTNFQDNNKCQNISVFENIKYSEYITEAKNLFVTSESNEELITNINEFIKNKINLNYIDENKELTIQKDDETIITFTSTNIQKIKEESNSNASTINLGKCEDILKYVYNISKESNLYILKIDKEQKGKNYPSVEYEVFYPINNDKIDILNLSYCESTNIEISFPIEINDTLDKYNPKSSYYNDICKKASSKYNTDITLNDRRNEFIKNNMSLCEENCELNNYDYYNKRAKCSCNVKTTLYLNNDKFDTKNLMKNFIDIKTITNIGIVKCYKIVFNKKNIKNNYGLFFFFFMFILYFICINVFYCKSLKNLIEEIIKIIEMKNKENHINKNNIKNNKSKIIYSYNNKNIIKRSKNKKKDKKLMKFDSIYKKLDKDSDLTMIKNNIKNKNINKKDNNILEYTDSELNSLAFGEALIKDKRSYCQYYWSLLKKKQSILFSFYPNKDYNSQIIKIFLFFFFYASDMTINALFFTDDTMHKIYIDSGSFNFIYQIPQIIYSFLISNIINFIIEFFSLSEDTIISIKTKNLNLKQRNKIISYMKTKFCIFFIITFILLLIFSFYISCFCCIYENTQMHLIKDSLLSFGVSLLYPVFTNLITGIFRIAALNDKKGGSLCMYKLSQVIEFLNL